MPAECAGSSFKPHKRQNLHAHNIGCLRHVELEAHFFHAAPHAYQLWAGGMQQLHEQAGGAQRIRSMKCKGLMYI